MHENVSARPLNTRHNNKALEYEFFFNALCQGSNMNRGGRNQNKIRKNGPPTLLVDPVVSKKKKQNDLGEEIGVAGKTFLQPCTTKRNPKHGKITSWKVMFLSRLGH